MELSEKEREIILNAIKNFDGPQEIIEKVGTDFRKQELGNDEMQFITDALRQHVSEVKRVRQMPNQLLNAMVKEEEYLELIERLIEKLQPANA